MSAMGAMANSAAAPAKPVRLIQITDTHLGVSDGARLLGLNTDQSLLDVLDLIQHEQSHYDALICTGDVAGEPEAACYWRFIDTLRRYTDRPLGWLPGNHDLAGVMQDLEHPHQPAGRLMALGGWQIILLDSSVPGHVHGHLADEELDFLAASLTAAPDTPTLVMLHHQPVPVGSDWIDQYQVRNHEAFFALIDAHPQVKAISWGHVHQLHEQWRGEVLLMATPSTCVQFKPDCDDFTVDTAMPGYRWLDLYPDGRIHTGVSRVREKNYSIDYSSAGY